MSPKLSRGNICQIWTWYSLNNQYFDNSKKQVKLRNGIMLLSNPEDTNVFSIAIQIRWKFRFTLTSILTQWSLQNFVHGTTACAKTCRDLMASNGIMARRNFNRIWFTGKKTLVKRTPAVLTIFGYSKHRRSVHAGNIFLLGAITRNHSRRLLWDRNYGLLQFQRRCTCTA